MRTGSLLACLVFSAAPALPQAVLTLTATAENAGDVRIDILRWSTDAERDQLITAWTQPGAQGRGGRGETADAPPATPEASLLAALNNAPVVGHLWSSSEVAGYILHYAVKLAEPDGGQRIILMTDRRLGAFTAAWKATGTASNYDFSLVEVHLNSKGQGEGKTSLAGKVAPDAGAKTMALDGYAALPVTLKNVKPRN